MTHVVIVGAGIIGLFCAVRLVREGARVTLLEAEPDDRDMFRPGASAAAAGMLAPFDAEGGTHEALALESFELWRTIARTEAWADAIRFDGGVIASASERDAAALQARIMVAGRRATALSGGDVTKRLGVPAAFDHAVFVEDEGVADPVHTLTALSHEARRLGVAVRYDQDVASGSANSVRTFTGETYEADQVLLAPGAWANDSLLASAPALKRLRAGKGHLVALALPKPLKANLHANGVYITRRRDDVVVGSDLQLDRFERRAEKDAVERLTAAAQAVLPGVQPAGRAWAGIRPMSPDGWPMIGKANGMLVAAGHSRNGWLLAPITAEVVTAYVFGASIPPMWAALSPQRFET